ncbi:hypothetical protein NO995_06375 [Aestuariibaculum sp. M13]|uniref:hypothetical protein n=1 Tax=Aestuariibaculum sp. M13 TaxID=2967132 RepID=UPI002159E1F8|nr:hypothetical protein [Aestuariibaculum sp. M13]MCR8667298.1 hypothetical protein [Aestuariibaculum sp. M13]
MRIQNKNIIASILFVLISFVCFAQKMPPSPEKSNGTIPVGLSVDLGVVAILFLGMLYGSKKLLSKKD